jgi:hypothetical protein
MSSQTPNAGTFVISQRLKTFMAASMFFGVLTFLVALRLDAQRAWMAYLIPMFYFLSLALGGLFFAAVQHVTKAGWSVNIRRLAEGFTDYIPYAAITLMVFLLGTQKIYKWMNLDLVAADELLDHKSAYLNMGFFLVRLCVFFGLWILFQRVIVGRSIEQDRTGSEELTHKQVGTSIAFILVFALSYSFLSVDLLMSLEPHWFSTIFGVYCFAGLFQSTIAFLILTIIYMHKKGLLAGYVTQDHLHDLGKFLFAFTVFWAYIAFSQYMLIWYANLPEETIFIIPRTEHGWVWVSIFLMLGKFIVPFFALLPRWAKRTPSHLGAVSILILVMQYVDIYWLAYPALYEHKVVFGLQEILVFLGFLGAFLWVLTRFFTKHNLVPVKDPRIHESLHHHVTY